MVSRVLSRSPKHYWGIGERPNTAIATNLTVRQLSESCLKLLLIKNIKYKLMGPIKKVDFLETGPTRTYNGR
jgi:hypothetical protein